MSDENTQGQEAPEMEASDVPFTIVAQYVRDLSFENPNAADVLRGGKGLPDMDIAIGMDARKLPDDKDDALYEVVLNVRAEAKREDATLFLAELQYGCVVSVGDEIPEDGHHPFLFIEIPRLMFPFARQIMSAVTTQGGYPPLLLNPVDFHQLYMQRFGKEIEEARTEFEKNLHEDIQKG